MEYQLENNTFLSLNMMFKMWKYSFLLPKYIYQGKEGTFKYKKDKKRFVICLFIFLLDIIDIYPPYVAGNKMILDIITNRIYKTLLTFFTWISIFVVYWRVEDIERLLENFKMMNIKKKELSRNFWISRKVWELLWLFYMIMMHLIMLMLNLVFFFNLHDRPINFLSLSVFYFNSMLIILLEQFYITTQFILLHHSKISNRFLENDDVGYSKIIDFEGFNDLINQTTKKFSTDFSYVILMKCLFIFESIMMALFSGFNVEFYKENLPIYISLCLFMPCWICIEISMLTVLIFLNMEIEKESRLAVENIYGIQTKIGRKNLPYKSVELFLLKSKLNELQFVVCGFLPLNWSLIYSMVAGITTYLVYLIQLREMEQSRSNVQ